MRYKAENEAMDQSDRSVRVLCVLVGHVGTRTSFPCWCILTSKVPEYKNKNLLQHSWRKRKRKI